MTDDELRRLRELLENIRDQAHEHHRRSSHQVTATIAHQATEALSIMDNKPYQESML